MEAKHSSSTPLLLARPYFRAIGTCFLHDYHGDFSDHRKKIPDAQVKTVHQQILRRWVCCREQQVCGGIVGYFTWDCPSSAQALCITFDRRQSSPRHHSGLASYKSNLDSKCRTRCNGKYICKTHARLAASGLKWPCEHAADRRTALWIILVAQTGPVRREP